MNIFSQIKNSIYNKDYYQKIISEQSFKYSFKYLIKLSLILALISLVIFSFKLPKINKEIKNAISSFVLDYPEDLIISLKKGEVSINQIEPYIFPLFKDSQSKDLLELKEEGINNFLVINTKSDYSLDKFNSYSTLLLLGKKELIAKKTDNGLEAHSLEVFGDVEIDKSWLLEKENFFFNKIFPWIFVLLIPFMYIFISIGILITALVLAFWYALIILIIFKFKKINLSYKKCYLVALHAGTFILILTSFNNYIFFINNFFIKTLLLIIIILLNFKFLEETKKEELATSI